MAANVTTPNRAYQDMISAIEASLTRGLLAAQKAVEYQRVKTYWQVGRDITRAVASSGGQLVPGEDFYRDVARDIHAACGLRLSFDLVRRTVQFHKEYPRFPAGTPLSFTHYIVLMRVADPRRRRKLEQDAIRKNLIAEDLKKILTQRKISRLPAPEGKRLKVERGEPFVYYVRPETSLDGARAMRIDCGFKLTQEIPPGNPRVFRQARPVRSVKENGRYRIESFKDGNEARYTYPATVLRVVDGDTLDVHIDVGFGIALSDRLRLKGINAPELTSEPGRLARAFLEKHLKQCPLIILRTKKTGVYGRWLADIFTLPGCDDPYTIAAEGEYLNQRLLEEGLAEIYQEQ